jgi:hypothetical protein
MSAEVKDDDLKTDEDIRSSAPSAPASYLYKFYITLVSVSMHWHPVAC